MNIPGARRLAKDHSEGTERPLGANPSGSFLSRGTGAEAPDSRPNPTGRVGCNAGGGNSSGRARALRMCRGRTDRPEVTFQAARREPFGFVPLKRNPALKRRIPAPTRWVEWAAMPGAGIASHVSRKKGQARGHLPGRSARTLRVRSSEEEPALSRRRFPLRPDGSSELHAGGGNRTRTPLRTAAFEAAASTVPPPRPGSQEYTKTGPSGSVELSAGPPPDLAGATSGA